jgi:insulysin
MWPIPDLHPYYKVNPGHYLGHLIGHEGQGSLLSELKNRGWVNELVGGQHGGAKGFMFFGVNVDLTEEGIEHVDDIVTLIFQYLNLMRKEGPHEWIFRECQDLSAMSFRFKDKERPTTYTCHIAASLHDYPINEVLSGGYLFDRYDPELISSVLDKLQPEFTRVTVIGMKFAGKTNLKEPWYGTEYSVADLPEDLLQRWQDAGLHKNLRIPERNEFIPSNFDILPRDDEPSPFPVVLRDSKMTRLWYRQDDKFLLPKACINIQFTSPYAYMDPLSTNLTHIFSVLLKDALTEYTYNAELAGLGYNIHSTIYGLILSIKGYNDKQHVLLQKLMEKIATYQIDEKRFDILLERYIRGLKNFRAEQPHQHAIYYTNVLSAEQFWTKDELLEATEGMTVKKLEAFIPHLFSQLFIEMLVYGNVTKQKSMELADIVEHRLVTKFQTRPLLPSLRRRYREVQLPDGCCFIYRQQNDVHKCSSLEVYYQCSVEETRANMLLELFCQIISEPCFDILRTKEQLGYIVFSGVRRSNGVQGLRVIVQSDKSPEYVEGRIEVFLNKMKVMIEDMPDEEFSKHIMALAVKRLEKPKKMAVQNAKYWSEIANSLYNFNRDEIEVSHLKCLTRQDILAFYNELIAPDSPRRHKLSVHVVSTVLPTSEDNLDSVVIDDAPGLEAAVIAETLSAEPTEDDGIELMRTVQQNATLITDVNAFKHELALFPLPKPYIDIASVTDIVATNKSKL